jgi:capsular exopolysaccharide synthesis family protein
MLAFFVVVVLGVTILTLVAPRIYLSEAKLLVRLGRESVALDPTAATGQIVPVQRSRQSEILTELDILRSRKIAEKVVDAMGPEAILKASAGEAAGLRARNPGFFTKFTRKIRRAARILRRRLPRIGSGQAISRRDKAVLAIMENSHISTEKEISNTIDIRFEAKSPRSAQEVVKALVDVYLEEHIGVHKTPGSFEFFTRQSDLARDKLMELEQRLRAVGKGTSIALIDEQLKVALGRVSSLQEQIDRDQASLAASKAKAQKLSETLDVLPETVVTTSTTGFPNQAAERMTERLYELELKEQNLLSNYDPQSRQVEDVRRQIAEAREILENEQRIRTQTTTGMNNAQQETQIALLQEQAKIAALETEVSHLRQGLAQAQVQLQGLNETAAEMKRLNREIEMHEGNYRKYTENLEQARIDQALMVGRMSNITTLQPATLPIMPVRPRTRLQLLLGLLLGAFGAISLAFACEYLDHTIRTPQEVEKRLGLPVLAYVPRTSENTICPMGRRDGLYAGCANTSGPASERWDIPEPVEGHYELLRQRILSSWPNRNRRGRVIAIMASRRGEGVSAVSANLAAAMSRSGAGPVLLMDANPTSPSQDRIFQVKASRGLFDALSNGHECSNLIRSLPVENLSLLPAGTANGHRLEGPDPTELGKMLNELRKKYRFIVIDVPPVADVNWAVRLAGVCDGVGLVVEAEKSRWEAAQATKEQLLMSKANILGVVLNKRQFSIPGWLYGVV